MKTVGKFLKDERLKKKYSLAKVENQTKIKKEFVQAIENEQWPLLPDYAVVLGFVKNLASFLGLDEKKASAFLRRDYPPIKLAINPKPDISSKFIWSPKLTFFLSIAVVTILVLGYLVFQYTKFSRPPFLKVDEPKDGQVVSSRSVRVIGKVDSGSTIKINNQPILIDENGNFSNEIQIYEGTNQIIVKARSRSGKETTVYRTIKPEIK